MATATKKQCEKRAAELGVTIEDRCDGDPANWMQEIELIAPTGKVFSGTSTHAVVITKGNAGLIPKHELWGWAIEDMKYGLEDCEEHQRGECEWCGDYDEEAA